MARVSGWRHNSSRKNSSSGAFGSAQARRVFAGPGRPRFSRRRLACGAGQLAPGHEGAKQWRTKAPAEGERGVMRRPGEIETREAGQASGLLLACPAGWRSSAQRSGGVLA